MEPLAMSVLRRQLDLLRMETDDDSIYVEADMALLVRIHTATGNLPPDSTSPATTSIHSR